MVSRRDFSSCVCVCVRLRCVVLCLLLSSVAFAFVVLTRTPPKVERVAPTKKNSGQCKNKQNVQIHHINPVRHQRPWLWFSIEPAVAETLSSFGYQFTCRYLRRLCRQQRTIQPMMIVTTIKPTAAATTYLAAPPG